MPKLSELIANEASLTIPFEGEDLHIAYQPRVLTAEWQQEIADAEREGDDQEAMLYGPLKEVVISWDLEQDDGEPYPLTTEAMQKLPRVLLTSVLLAVVTSARPNLPTRPGSSTGGLSAPSDRRTSRRTGTP